MNGLSSGLNVPSPLAWAQDDALGVPAYKLRWSETQLPNLHAAWARIGEKDVTVLTKGGNLVVLAITRDAWRVLMRDAALQVDGYDFYLVPV